MLRMDTAHTQLCLLSVHVHCSLFSVHIEESVQCLLGLRLQCFFSFCITYNVRTYNIVSFNSVSLYPAVFWYILLYFAVFACIRSYSVVFSWNFLNFFDCLQQINIYVKLHSMCSDVWISIAYKSYLPKRKHTQFFQIYRCFFNR